MGNADSGLEEAYKLSYFKELAQDYTHLRTESNRRFGQGQLYRHNADPKNILLVRQAIFYGEPSSSEFKQRVESFKNIQSPQICQLRDYFSSFT